MIGTTKDKKVGKEMDQADVTPGSHSLLISD